MTARTAVAHPILNLLIAIVIGFLSVGALFCLMLGVAHADILPHALVLAQAAPPDFLHAVVFPALLRAALDPQVWAIVLGITYAIVAHYSTVKAAFVKDAIAKAFHIVEDLKATGNLPDGAKKPVVALEQLQAILDQKNLTVTGEIAALATTSWSAMHGEQKVAA